MLINIFDLVVPAYWPLLKIFKQILINDKEINTHKIPLKYTIAGSRVGGKTRVIFVIFAILFSLAHPKSFILIQVKKGAQKEDVWKAIWDFIENLLFVKEKVASSLKNPMDITFLNKSVICIRSLTTKDSNEIALKGMPRFINLQKAVIISEECNTFNSNKYFIPAREAIVANQIFEFQVFNTDHINQFVVKRMEQYLPENETKMRNIGNMLKIKKINGIWEYFQRTNTLCTWHVLPAIKKLQIVADDTADPIRGRVARWGLNGRDGKLLYYNLSAKHFIQTDKLSARFNKLQKLPYRFFKKYRIGIDEGHAHDKFVISLWGITHQNRAVWLEGWSQTPRPFRDLNISFLAQESVKRIKEWSLNYVNMYYLRLNIRVEWAGNGVAIKQEMARELSKTSLNYTIDKAKKVINQSIQKRIQGSKDSQPILEARAALKNLMFGRNQMIFWNPPNELKNEYFNRGRDEENLIVDGNDHWGDADDYALIPEYGVMIDNIPEKSFYDELKEGHFV